MADDRDLSSKGEKKVSTELFHDAEVIEDEQAVVSGSDLPNQSTEVALSDDPTIMLMQMAKDLDVDKLEKLINMKNAQEERAAKRDYDLHFAAMQQEFEPVQRTKQGDKSKYAPLDSLQKQYGPIIAKHGFSYRWSEEPIGEGGLRVILTISGYGHSESNHKDLPKYEPDVGGSSGKPIMNSMQAEGVRSTYGRRYTFVSGLGLIIEDEDTDGTYEDALKYAEQVMAIRTADKATILDVWKEVYTQFKSDLKAIAILTAEYEKRKKALR